MAALQDRRTPSRPGTTWRFCSRHWRGSDANDYEVAAISTNAVIGPVPLVSPCGGPSVACSITFTDSDVILVNRDTRGLRW